MAGNIPVDCEYILCRAYRIIWYGWYNVHMYITGLLYVQVLTCMYVMGCVLSMMRHVITK